MHGAIMKKILVTAFALGGICTGSAAYAASDDDVTARLAALEQENAAIRKENAALRENKRLRQQNVSLKSDAAPAAQSDTKRADPFAAYAADLPLAYKAGPLGRPGQFRIWGEGGAIFSGGDAATQQYNLIDLTSAIPFGVGLGIGGARATTMDLKPNTGWEAAAGFDYRFADSPWHVSGQFRYYQGHASGSASSNGALDPSILALLGGGAVGASSGGNQAFTAKNRETHWMADIAIGRDVLGSGPTAMQLKAGLRIAEFESVISSAETINSLTTFGAPIEFTDGLFVSSLGFNSTNQGQTRRRFLGAGPRVGVEGSVPLAGNWAFDYLADAAVLFGTQRLTSNSSTSFSVSPPLLGLLIGSGGGLSSSAADQRFATVFNADLQAGVSYWMTPNVKLSASYRLDAYFNVLNTSFDPAVKQNSDRYIHGPRVGISATF